MELFFIALVAYTIGSTPTAYLIVKRRHGLDIRREGSGNVGAMNSFEVTNSKRLALSIACVDIGKGLMAVGAARFVAGPSLVAASVGAMGVVLGHVFSPWIGFRGGRGLASAAGALSLIAPVLVLVWVAIWFIARAVTGDIVRANYVALCALGMMAFVEWEWLWWPASVMPDWSLWRARSLVWALIGLVAIAHRRRRLGRR